MVKRAIIEINESKCDGCGQCIPDCPEGAIQIIDNKARLVSDLFCDGLGACLGSCPKNAIKIVKREAEPYDERKVMERIVEQGENVIKAHLQHLKEHGEEGYLKTAIDYLEEKGIDNPLKGSAGEALPCGCPGSRVVDRREEKSSSSPGTEQQSELGQWPVQLHLVPPGAPYFSGADLLISADCVPFASANFHKNFLKNRSLVIGCPKLDDIEAYQEKITEIIKNNDIKSITVAIMEVPCCYGLYTVVEQALKESGKNIPLTRKIVSISGEEQDI